MKAALVTTFGENPRYADVPEPTATENDEVVVDVLASALSPRVRSQAAGVALHQHWRPPTHSWHRRRRAIDRRNTGLLPLAGHQQGLDG